MTKAKLGRPKLPPEERRSATVTVRMTPDLKALLMDWARESGMPLSDLASNVLEEAALKSGWELLQR